MKREEAIDRLRKISEKTPIRTNGNDLVAITMAIQALSQEPTDAISRDAVMRLIENKPYDWSNLTERHNMLMEICKLPSVTQKSETVTEFADRCRECGARYGKLLKQKSGKWIMSDDGLYRPICDNCGAHPWKGYIPTVEEATEVFKYCPNCGAKMESEDKEC